MKILQKLIIDQDSVNDVEVLILDLFFKDGDYVKKDDIICEYETSKAVISIESNVNGYVFFYVKSEEMVSIGSPIGEINDEPVKIGIEKPKDSNQNIIDEIPEINVQKNIGANTGNESVLNDKKIEKKIELGLNKKNVINTIFSKKAESLIKHEKLKKYFFINEDFVNEHDVLKYLNSDEFENQNNLKTNLNLKASLELKKTVKPSKKEKIIVFCPSFVGMQVIWDIIKFQDDKEIIGYVTDDKYKDSIDLNFLDCNIFDFHEKINKNKYDSIIVALGGSLKSMQFRKKVFDFYKERNIPFTNLIAEDVNIRNDVNIGQGNIIGSGVFIGSNSEIGDNNFISYMTTIGHHNKIGSCNLFAPGVMMSGLVEIGDNCIITTGVNFIDRVKVGNNVILPLGYNVVRNIPDNKIFKIK
ncbi:hypothetical protein N8769_01475 [Flavobacteriaceae bacterium]|nr:hypothetical protein [Flavobacteriaceae bacterium]